jgi:hypothetical protein
VQDQPNQLSPIICDPFCSTYSESDRLGKMKIQIYIVVNFSALLPNQTSNERKWKSVAYWTFLSMNIQHYQPVHQSIRLKKRERFQIKKR